MTAAPRTFGGVSNAASPSQTKAIRRGSAGGVSEVHPSSGRPPRREHWGDDRRRQLPLGERPRDEGGRGECGRRVLFPADRHAADIGERIERDVSLPEEGHGRRVGRGSSGDASPPRPTAATQMLGGGSPAASPSLKMATRRDLAAPNDRHAVNTWGRIAGGVPLPEKGSATRFHRRCTGGALSLQMTATPQIWGGGSPAGFPSLKMATRRGAGGRRTGGAPSTRTTATPRILWGGDRWCRLLP